MRLFIPKRLALVLGVAALLGAGGTATAAASESATQLQRVVSVHAGQSGQLAGQGIFDDLWTIVQSNGGTGQLFNGVPDAGGHYTGFAASSSGDARGSIEGQLNGDYVLFDIHWNFGHTGRYTGHRGFDGTWSGTTVDLDYPPSQAAWFASRG